MTIKIGWQKYRIVMVHKIMENEGNQELYGHQLGGHGLLKISKRFGKRRAQCCFIHEVLHAIDEQRVIGLTEPQIENLANGIMAAILDNPEEINTFLSWVTKKENENES